MSARSSPTPATSCARRSRSCKAELELALREGRSHEELEAALRSAAEETDRLVQLAEDLLVIARVRGGPAAGPAPSRRSTRGVRGRAGAVRRRRRPALAVAPDGPERRRRPVRLQQALGNLVDNALRHGGGARGAAAERVNGRRRAARARRRAGLPR